MINQAEYRGFLIEAFSEGANSRLVATDGQITFEEAVWLEAEERAGQHMKRRIDDYLGAPLATWEDLNIAVINYGITQDYEEVYPNPKGLEAIVRRFVKQNPELFKE